MTTISPAALAGRRRVEFVPAPAPAAPLCKRNHTLYQRTEFRDGETVSDVSCARCLRAERIQAAAYAVRFVKQIVCVKNCRLCGDSFEVKRYNTTQKLCYECKESPKKPLNSIMCVDNCVFCGAEFRKSRSNADQKKCSKKCSVFVTARAAAEAYAISNAEPVTVKPDSVTLKPEPTMFQKTAVFSCSMCGKKSTSAVCENCNEKHILNNYMTFEKKTFTERTTVINFRKVHEKDAKEGLLDFRCPSPAKKVYRTEDEANSFIALVHADDRFIHPYVCRCGAIHIGH